MLVALVALSVPGPLVFSAGNEEALLKTQVRVARLDICCMRTELPGNIPDLLEIELCLRRHPAGDRRLYSPALFPRRPAPKGSRKNEWKLSGD
jgi:hypothetical protein